MKHQIKRFYALFLTLVLLLGCTVTASAEGGAYQINVDGNSFSSDKDASAPDGAWRYRADLKQLWLSQYRGGAITSTGDLTIFVEKESSVTANGIAVQAAGTVKLSGEKLTVTSVHETAVKGTKVVVSDTNKGVVSKAMVIRGGDGGRGVEADEVVIPTRSEIQAQIYGGVSAKTFRANNCEIWGGITFTESCTFWAGYNTIHGGINGNGKQWEYQRDHMDCVQSGDTILLTPKTHVITLNGNGGTLNGKAVVTEEKLYDPQLNRIIFLSNYVFQRPGYVQVGWSKTSNGPVDVGFSDNIWADEDPTLYAVWVPVAQGDIVLLTGGCKESWSPVFPDGSLYRIVKQSSFTLPASLQKREDGVNIHVAAWTEEPAWNRISQGGPNNSLPKSSYMKNVFFSGSTVSADSARVRVLYAVEEEHIHSVFHLNGATTAAGADLLLSQMDTALDLNQGVYDDFQEKYIPFQMPRGKTFLGWASSATASSAEFRPGDSFYDYSFEQQSHPIKHVYAVWKNDASSWETQSGTGQEDPGKDSPEEKIIVTEEITADGTVKRTTTWPDGVIAVESKMTDGAKTILLTGRDGQTMMDIRISSHPSQGKTFSDVHSGAWYEKAVAGATGYQLFAGVSETHFSPNMPMNRAMLVRVLYNLSGQPEFGTENHPFLDVKSGSWYDDSVSWASQLGITSGTGNGFSPDTDISREQLVTMLYRFAHLMGADTDKRASLTGFQDASSTSNYAKEAMQWAVANGFITGRSTGSGTVLAAGNSATRAEVAAVMVRFILFLKG